MSAQVIEANEPAAVEAAPLWPRPIGKPTMPLDLNSVVAYNLKAIRLMRGLTQEQVAERLAVFTGHRLRQATISLMERSFDGERRRLFNAHDLYLLAKVFDVPIVYFFLPPPTCPEQTITNTGEPVTAVLDTLFGTPASLRAVDHRLVEIAHLREETPSSRPALDPIRGPATGELHVSRLAEVDCHARLREVASLLQQLVDYHRADDRADPASTILQ